MEGMILAFVIIIVSLYWLLRETNNLTVNLAREVKQKPENNGYMPVIESEESKTDLYFKRTIQGLWFNFETFCGTTTYVDNCSTGQNRTNFYAIDRERAELLNIDITKYDNKFRR
jgi:hypothetical protein